MSWLRKEWRSSFHKLNINENCQTLLLITKRRTSDDAELLITYQKSPGDALYFIRWAGSSKSAEVFTRSTPLVAMGQPCSNQAFSRDFFLKHLSVLLSIARQKERIATSRRHLHASETQLNFLRRWGYRISQFLGKRVDAVRASGQKMKWLFSSLETGLLGGYCNFLKGKLLWSFLRLLFASCGTVPPHLMQLL